MAIPDSSMGTWREMTLSEMRGWEGPRAGRTEERSLVWLHSPPPPARGLGGLRTQTPRGNWTVPHAL